MNKISEVAKLLGVEIGEEFNILSYDYVPKICSPYKFTENGLIDCENDCSNNTIGYLLTGKYIIEKLPFKPKVGDKYYYVISIGTILWRVWENSTLDYYNYNANNCFRREQEITEEMIAMIVDKITSKYNNN